MSKTIEHIIEESSKIKHHSYENFVNAIIVDDLSFNIIQYKSSDSFMTNDIAVYNSFYEKLYSVYNDPSRLTQDEIRDFSQTMLDVYFEARLLYAGVEPGAKKFQTPTHISSKVSKHWDNKHKYSLTCPVETYISGNSVSSLSSWGTSSFVAAYNYAFKGEDVFMVQSFELNVLSQNDISKNKSCNVKIHGFKYDNKYYLNIVATPDSGVNFNFCSSSPTLDDFLQSMKYNLSEYIFNCYYRDRIKELTDENVEFKDFSFDVYNTIFDMVGI